MPAELRDDPSSPVIQTHSAALGRRAAWGEAVRGHGWSKEPRGRPAQPHPGQSVQVPASTLIHKLCPAPPSVWVHVWAEHATHGGRCCFVRPLARPDLSDAGCGAGEAGDAARNLGGRGSVVFKRARLQQGSGEGGGGGEGWWCRVGGGVQGWGLPVDWVRGCGAPVGSGRQGGSGWAERHMYGDTKSAPKRGGRRVEVWGGA